MDRNLLVKAVAKTQDYKTAISDLPLNRLRYRSIQGYPPFRDIKKELLHSWFLLQCQYSQELGEIFGITPEEAFSHAIGTEQIAKAECKFLWPVPDLVEALEKTLIPSVPVPLRQVVPILVLILPESHPAIYIKIVSQFFTQKEYFDYLKTAEGPHAPPEEVQEYIGFFSTRAQMADCELYCRTWFLDGVIAAGASSTQRSFGKITQSQREQLAKLEKLAVNLMLYLSAYPEIAILEPAQSQKKSGRGFGDSASTRKVYEPQTIGDNFKIRRKYISSDCPRKRPHASPRVHWRMGHYRSVPIGRKRRDRKLVWISPVLVNAGRTG